MTGSCQCLVPLMRRNYCPNKTSPKTLWCPYIHRMRGKHNRLKSERKCELCMRPLTPGKSASRAVILILRLLRFDLEKSRVKEAELNSGTHLLKIRTAKLKASQDITKFYPSECRFHGKSDCLIKNMINNAHQGIPPSSEPCLKVLLKASHAFFKH